MDQTTRILLLTYQKTVIEQRQTQPQVKVPYVVPHLYGPVQIAYANLIHNTPNRMLGNVY